MRTSRNLTIFGKVVREGFNPENPQGRALTFSLKTDENKIIPCKLGVPFNILNEYLMCILVKGEEVQVNGSFAADSFFIVKSMKVNGESFPKPVVK